MMFAPVIKYMTLEQNMGCPASYNWSIWDRDSIIYMIYMMRDDLVGRELPVEKFHSKLINHIKRQVPIKSRKYFEPQIKSQTIWVGGCYCSDHDRDRKTSIELHIGYSKKDRNKTIVVTSQRFIRLCVRIADVLLHEIIHMRQSRQRNFKCLPGYQSAASDPKQRIEQEYLGDRDEVDAYAYNMACELHDKFDGKIKDITKYLNEEQKGKRRVYNTWRTYLKTFNWDQNHQVIKRIKKRCIYYLNKSQINRPIHPKDWIHR